SSWRDVAERARCCPEPRFRLRVSAAPRESFFPRGDAESRRNSWNALQKRGEETVRIRGERRRVEGLFHAGWRLRADRFAPDLARRHHRKIRMASQKFGDLVFIL